jgi:hypothetical protein
MDQVHVIRHKVLVEGNSLRRVARETKVSRNTVRHYLGSEALVGERRASRRPRPKQEALAAALLAAALPGLLEQSKQWTDRKQRLTAQRLHEFLCAKGITVGYTLVKKSIEAAEPTWLSRKVRQVSEGGLRSRLGVKRETLRSLISMPSLSNSPWILGAPQVTLASAIRRMSRLTSAETSSWPACGSEISISRTDGSRRDASGPRCPA